MKAIDELKHEHRVIELVLTGLEGIALRSERQGRLDRERADKALEILRNFADKCHHGKEERHLFVLLEERGVPREGGPIGVMLQEREQGRSHIGAMVQSLPGAAVSAGRELGDFVQHANAYVGLLRPHIQKEDNVLYPMAERVCTPQDDRQLLAAFESIEREEMGEGVHEKYHQWAQEMAETHR